MVDYFLRSTFLNSSGQVVVFAYQVGNGSVDHSYWGPSELESSTQYPRPAWLADDLHPSRRHDGQRRGGAGGGVHPHQVKQPQ